MTPWQVIEQALLHRRPSRSPKWLADQLGEKIQVISNWKARGVPARRYREIAQALGITVDQLEGLAPLPWDLEGEDLRPDVYAAAAAMNSLPDRQRKWVLDVLASTIEAARRTITNGTDMSLAAWSIVIGALLVLIDVLRQLAG